MGLGKLSNVAIAAARIALPIDHTLDDRLVS